MEGWISLHRRFLDWEWYDDNNTMKLFVHILLKANHKKKNWKGIVINKGQLLTGRKQLSYETKLSEQQIRTSLKKLISTNEITIKTTNLYSLVSITNWNKYQGNNQRITNEQPTDNQQVTTTNNVNNEKNVNNDNKKTESEIPNFEEFKTYALEKEPKINVQELQLKYEAWKVNGWKNGNDKKIKNWKSSVLNIIPHLKKNEASGKKKINDKWELKRQQQNNN